MIIFSITIVVALFIFIVALVSNNKKKLIKKTQKNGLSTILQLLNLVTNIQKHRGLNAAWIGGDSKAHEQLVTLKKQILVDIKNIHEDKVITDERWLAFIDHWHRLLEFNNELTISNSFEQHTSMIRNLIYLIEDTAEFSYLVSDYLPELPNIGFTWRELTAAIETIGQSRAIGTGVAVESFCSSVDKIKLNFLSETIKNLTENTLKQLSYLPNEKSQHDQLINNAMSKMKELNYIIANELIDAPVITVDTLKYFDLATITLQQVSDVFIHQTKQVEQLLN